ncbi:MAG: hypothetical protein OXF02_02600 [Simkaniaceae bacterium]|nr:hypothetical protein [Simkaniaceae bacterium]
MFDLSRTSVSENTRRLMSVAWRRFVAFCEEQGVDPRKGTELAVSLFITNPYEEGRAPSTASVYAFCLAGAFEEKGIAFDVSNKNIRRLLSAVRREGRAPK